MYCLVSIIGNVFRMSEKGICILTPGTKVLVKWTYFQESHRIVDVWDNAIKTNLWWHYVNNSSDDDWDGVLDSIGDVPICVCYRSHRKVLE